MSGKLRELEPGGRIATREGERARTWFGAVCAGAQGFAKRVQERDKYPFSMQLCKNMNGTSVEVVVWSKEMCC